MSTTSKNQLSPWKNKLHEVIYEADTRAGKWFDIVLLIAIFLSVTTVMLESVNSISALYGEELRIIEWTFTILFTIEYIARLVSIGKPLKYVFSFYGIVDFISIIPTYLGIFITGTHSLAIIRSIRLLRVFRILKLAQFMGEANVLIKALKASRPKIVVFLFALLSLTFILGTLMYLIETPESGFTSIPKSIYWAIVTLTTVGYGDIAPQTILGQTLASIIMIIGYAIIAVPTGIVGAEIAITSKKSNTQVCPSCSLEGHDDNAKHCKFCGKSL
ncbi:MAG: ion transporter [Flavobacteriales bacterium]|nr:MAG: ion transporter [Flavobacteriales bacterium]